MIVVDDVTKTFRGGSGLDHCSFTCADGEITYLLGPNGAGKTTLLRIIAGALQQDSGTIRVNGRDIRRATNLIRELGVNLDSFGVDRSHTAWTHILWQARAAGLSTGDARAVLDLVGLDAVRRRKLSTFSYGMLQRLGIASALLGDPRTIVLDEPLNGLDAEGIIWMRGLMESLTAQGVCFLVASHIFGEVEATASRVVILGAGSVVFDGRVDELVAMGEGPRPFESAYTALTAAHVRYSGTERRSR